jgi:hypothetical protein
MVDAWRMDYAIELSNMDVSNPHSACKMVMLQLFFMVKANNYRLFSFFIGRLEAVATETIRDKTFCLGIGNKHIIIEFCIFSIPMNKNTQVSKNVKSTCTVD